MTRAATPARFEHQRPGTAGPSSLGSPYNIRMLYEYFAGSTPLLINVPHAGVRVPEAIEARMAPVARSLPDTDWHVHRLVERAPEAGVALLRALHSRYVIDLNRGRDDKPLYAGPTSGLVPTETFAGEAVYAGQPPDTSEIEQRIERYWQPYHDKLAETLDGIRARHGHAVLLDVHSIRSRVPRLFDGRLPDLNLGTNNGASCDPDLRQKVADVLADASGFSHVVDGRFKGGYITRHYGQPEQGVHALQLEIAQACYMDETDPDRWDAERAAPLVAVLDDIIRLLVDWRPE